MGFIELKKGDLKLEITFFIFRGENDVLKNFHSLHKIRNFAD